ncbi:MAG: ATP-binding protein [Deltaproteobacteria bacterium]|jgi:DNA replication protein DnaC|nr:MAG: ATP-binding protein [Deltaproteobacteria bacterium]
MNNLEPLLKELGCKTPAGEIAPDRRDTILDFLKMEIEYRRQHKIKRLLSMSGIKHVKTLDQFDWQFNPKISKDDILTFVHSPWIENAFNLVLIGDTGLGKSHIASSICYEAILQGYSTACVTAFDLVSRIHKAYNPTSRIEYYAKVRVLCIDELGYTYHKKEDTDILFQIISKRNEILPTIVTTNLAPKEWGSIFSAAAASAILDRLSFNGRFITFEGRSYRLLKKHKLK